MPGFVLVLNDEVVPQERIHELKFRAGDEIYIISQLSGG
jgi:sulfur carrier protein ThiS